MADSVRPHRRQPTRLPHPWDSPGKNTGVGCHFLLQCMKVENEVTQSCPTLCDPMDCSPPGSSIHGTFQARVLEWVAIAFSDSVYTSLNWADNLHAVLNSSGKSRTNSNLESQLGKSWEVCPFHVWDFKLQFWRCLLITPGHRLIQPSVCMQKCSSDLVFKRLFVLSCES